MATEKPKVRKKYVGKAVASFLLVLFTMPLGHALMILMEHLLEPGTLHVCAFLMGAAGLLLTVAGVFVRTTCGRRCAASSAACSSGRAGWNFCSSIMPTASA